MQFAPVNCSLLYSQNIASPECNRRNNDAPPNRNAPSASRNKASKPLAQTSMTEQPTNQTSHKHFARQHSAATNSRAQVLNAHWKQPPHPVRTPRLTPYPTTNFQRTDVPRTCPFAHVRPLHVLILSHIFCKHNSLRTYKRPPMTHITFRHKPTHPLTRTYPQSTL